MDKNTPPLKVFDAVPAERNRGRTEQRKYELVVFPIGTKEKNKEINALL